MINHTFLVSLGVGSELWVEAFSRGRPTQGILLKFWQNITIKNNSIAAFVITRSIISDVIIGQYT